ncbi:MAG: ABC transporter ATP-binding protein [Aureispira sp.]|nr:ABC transporter ATP-binding protein [Aureispira sp.]
MRNLYQLFMVLDRWKRHYVFAGLLLAISSIIRMFEPKVLQIAVDGVVNFFHNGGQQIKTNTDAIAQLFYSILPEIQLNNLGWILICIGILFTVLAILQATTRFIASIITANSTEQAVKKLRDRLFGHIQALPLAQIDKTPTGEMIQRCTGDIDTIRKFIGTQITELIRLGAIFIGAFMMMWIVHIPYTLISISLVLPIVLTSYLFFKKEQKVWREHEDEQDKLTAIIQENLSGIRVVQAFAQEDSEIDRFTKQNMAKRDIGVRHIELHMKFWPISDFLVNIQIALSLFAGAYFSLTQQISIGEYASFFTYSVMVTWPMRNLGRIVSQLGMASVAMERIQQIFDAPEEDYSGEIDSIATLKGEIEFRNVSFQYPHQEKKEGKKETTILQRRAALHNVSFKIAAGQTLAIMGGTGAGKSTIIVLLMRFYEPDSGQILLDGQPLANYNKSLIRSKIGVVHQKPFLFSTTIKDNIAYAKATRNGSLGLHKSTEVEETILLEVAKDATVTDFIGKMTDGYNTVVGEKGVTLSGGQKQRVALARTLLSDPDILVLDDATSAVDTETEYNIQQALNKRMHKKTSLVIAHRLTSVQQADQIIVLDKGQVVETGNHQELLKANGFYKSVYDIQVKIEDDIRN